MNTAINPNSRWLFPGRRAGQPMNSGWLAALVNELRILTTTGRTAAIRQHVLDMPASVVADALSYHHVTATRIATRAGATWSRYASGDHSSLHPWSPKAAPVATGPPGRSAFSKPGGFDVACATLRYTDDNGRSFLHLLDPTGLEQAFARHAAHRPPLIEGQRGSGC